MRRIVNLLVVLGGLWFSIASASYGQASFTDEREDRVQLSTLIDHQQHGRNVRRSFTSDALATKFTTWAKARPRIQYSTWQALGDASVLILLEVREELRFVKVTFVTSDGHGISAGGPGFNPTTARQRVGELTITPWFGSNNFYVIGLGIPKHRTLVWREGLTNERVVGVYSAEGTSNQVGRGEAVPSPDQARPNERREQAQRMLLWLEEVAKSVRKGNRPNFSPSMDPDQVRSFKSWFKMFNTHAHLTVVVARPGTRSTWDHEAYIKDMFDDAPRWSTLRVTHFASDERRIESFTMERRMPANVPAALRDPSCYRIAGPWAKVPRLGESLIGPRPTTASTPSLALRRYRYKVTWEPNATWQGIPIIESPWLPGHRLARLADLPADNDCRQITETILATAKAGKWRQMKRYFSDNWSFARLSEWQGHAYPMLRTAKLSDVRVEPTWRVYVRSSSSFSLLYKGARYLLFYSKNEEGKVEIDEAPRGGGCFLEEPCIYPHESEEVQD